MACEASEKTYGMTCVQLLETDNIYNVHQNVQQYNDFYNISPPALPRPMEPHVCQVTRYILNNLKFGRLSAGGNYRFHCKSTQGGQLDC